MQDEGHEDTVIRRRPALRPDLDGDSDRIADDLDADTVIPDRTRSAGAWATVDGLIELVDPPVSDYRPRVPVADDENGAGAGAGAGADEPVAPAAFAAPAYRFSVNGQAPLLLDVPTVIGRNPKTPRIPGATTLRLITVPSPEHEVSGTHLELAQEGAAVVVTDLRSTNGTVVTMPDAERVGLRPGESFVAVPGSLVDIGDGNTIEILGVERLQPGHPEHTP